VDSAGQAAELEPWGAIAGEEYRVNQQPLAFWSIAAAEMLRQLQTAEEGLTSDEARQRLARYGSNLLKPKTRSDVFTLLLAQFKSPIILILLCATGLSFALRDPVGAFIILTIVLVSGLLTFGVLLFILHATPDQFRTGWFLESVVSAALIVLVIRSRKPCFKSRPSRYLFLATLSVVIVTAVFPFTPLGPILGFRQLPISFFVLIGIVIMAYIAAAEVAKTIFYKKAKF
jgi:magnesium-transporting ATPase (P-type)